MNVVTGATRCGRVFIADKYFLIDIHLDNTKCLKMFNKL